MLKEDNNIIIYYSKFEENYNYIKIILLINKKINYYLKYAEAYFKIKIFYKLLKGLR